MEDNNNTKLLKSLTQRKRKGSKSADKTKEESSKGSSSTKTQSKLYQMWQQYAKKPQTKTCVDVSIFFASVFVIYNYGDYLAQKFQDMCPTEQAILDMMQK